MVWPISSEEYEATIFYYYSTSGKKEEEKHRPKSEQISRILQTVKPELSWRSEGVREGREGKEGREGGRQSRRIRQRKIVQRAITVALGEFFSSVICRSSPSAEKCCVARAPSSQTPTDLAPNTSSSLDSGERLLRCYRATPPRANIWSLTCDWCSLTAVMATTRTRACD